MTLNDRVALQLGRALIEMEAKQLKIEELEAQIALLKDSEAKSANP